MYREVYGFRWVDVFIRMDFFFLGSGRKPVHSGARVACGAMGGLSLAMKEQELDGQTGAEPGTFRGGHPQPRLHLQGHEVHEASKYWQQAVDMNAHQRQADRQTISSPAEVCSR